MGESPLISVERAQRVIRDAVRPLDPVKLPLAEAQHRALAAGVVSDMDYPPFDRAMMDGYAVRARDAHEVPARLGVVGQVAAGMPQTNGPGPGEALQINTGAAVPGGADAVVPVEDTKADGRLVTVCAAVRQGQHIAARASCVAAGRQVLPPGTTLGPAELGAAAAAGAGRVRVYPAPRVAVLVTGDELIDVSRKPADGQIRNSNGYTLVGLLREAHVEPVDLGVVGDDRAALTERVRRGLAQDVLCITGGISMGAFDYVPSVLSDCAVKMCFQKVALKPGKPTLFGVLPGGTLVFGLPGNPGSVLVAFKLFVEPALGLLQGQRHVLAGAQPARLRGSIGATAGRRTYLPARAQVDADGRWWAAPAEWHGSGDPFGLARANALIERDPDSPSVAEGGTVRVLVWGLPRREA